MEGDLVRELVRKGKCNFEDLMEVYQSGLGQCEKVDFCIEVMRENPAFREEIVLKFIKAASGLLEQPREKSVKYQIPNCKPDFIKAKEDLGLYGKIQILQRVELDFVSRNLQKKAKKICEFQGKHAGSAYVQLKFTTKLEKKFKENIEANQFYLNISETNLQEILKQSQKSYTNTCIFLAESNRLNEKLINLNEEIIKRMEKYLSKQKSIAQDFTKMVLKREEEAQTKESNLQADIQILNSKISEFSNIPQIFPTSSSTNLTKIDFFTSACIYFLIGISIAFAFESFQIQYPPNQKYF